MIDRNSESMSSSARLATEELKVNGWQLQAMDAEDAWQKGMSYQPGVDCGRYARALITAANWEIEKGER